MSIYVGQCVCLLTYVLRKYARMSALVLECMQAYKCMSVNMYAFMFIGPCIILLVE